MRVLALIAGLCLSLVVSIAGSTNGCLELDGVEARAEIRGIEGFQSLDGDSTYTFQVWIKPRTQGGAGRGRILDQIGSSVTWYLSDEGRFGFRPNRTMGWQLCDANAISFWKWQHVAVTADGKMLRFFVNGKLLTSVPGSTILSITKKMIIIGNGEGEDKTARGFDGWLEDFQVESDCKWVADFTPPIRGRTGDSDSATVLYVSFDQISGRNIALDLSTYNAEMSLKNGATFTIEP